MTRNTQFRGWTVIAFSISEIWFSTYPTREAVIYTHIHTWKLFGIFIPQSNPLMLFQTENGIGSHLLESLVWLDCGFELTTHQSQSRHSTTRPLSWFKPFSPKVVYLRLHNLWLIQKIILWYVVISTKSLVKKSADESSFIGFTNTKFCTK